MISRAPMAMAVLCLCYHRDVANALTAPMRNLGMRQLIRRQHVATGGNKAALGFVHCEQLRCCTDSMRTATNVNHRSISTSRSLSNQRDIDSSTITNVAIVGGGLAGLSAAYHLLDISGKDNAHSKGLDITMFDKANVGEGGASSVAGGLIHPFSPRGKLIHFGLPALETSNQLIQMAAKHQPQCILRPHLYRIALSTKNVAQLEHTAENYPDLAVWMSNEEIQQHFGIDSLGGLKLGNGCKVIHVPSYLRGLWEECEERAKDRNSKIRWELMQMPNNDENGAQQLVMREPPIHAWKDMDSMNQHLAQYDAIIISAGAGIIHDHLISREDTLPAQLVRGQSIEMTLPSQEDYASEAFLCGKYVSPLPNIDTDDDNSSSQQRFVIGATHEFKPDPINPEEVVEELNSRTYPLAKHLWDNGTVDRLTMGVRLQSHRGGFGRMPIIGRYNNTSNDAICHDKSWIFTGLSSRGLIYHGLFGRWLANAVLHDNEEVLRNGFAEFDWWRKRVK